MITSAETAKTNLFSYLKKSIAVDGIAYGKGHTEYRLLRELFKVKGGLRTWRNEI